MLALSPTQFLGTWPFACAAHTSEAGFAEASRGECLLAGWVMVFGCNPIPLAVFGWLEAGHRALLKLQGRASQEVCRWTPCLPVIFGRLCSVGWRSGRAPVSEEMLS